MATPLATPVRARVLSAVLPSVLAGLVLLGTGTAAAAPTAGASAASSSAAPASLTALDAGDRAAVASAYQKVYLSAVAVTAPAVPAGAVASCDAGSSPAALGRANLDLVNFFRALSGVAPVSLDEQLSAKAQEAALISYANNSLDHYPGLDAKCFTVGGAEAAASSNLAKGFAGADVIPAYMTESGAGNVAVPHRWWLQRPTATTMGSGSFGTSHALWVTGDATTGAGPAFTSWPAAGYLPGALEPGGRWSITSWDGSDLRNAKVTVNRGDGTAVKVSAHPVGGYDSLVFELGDLARPRGSTVDTYTVTVSGIQRDGRAVPPYRYDVRLFDASTPVSADARTVPTIAGRALAGSVLEADAGNVSGVTYQWFRGSSPISGATTRSLTLGAADIGARMRVAVTTAVAGKAVTTTSGESSVVQAPSSLVVAAPAVAAPGALRLSITASAVGEATDGGTVEVREGARVVRSAIQLRAGQVTLDLTGLAPGDHRYAVHYAGTTRVAASSSTVDATVRDRATALVTATATSPAVGKLALTVRVAAPGETGLGGTVTVKDGTRTVASKVAVSNGTATWSATGLTSGTHRYVVAYGGTSRVKSATTTVAATVRAKAKPSLASTAASRSKGEVSVTTTVRASGQSNLGGNVTIKEGSKTLKSTITVSRGRATWSGTKIKSGRHTYTVIYSGTSQVLSRSTKVSVTVR